MATMKRRCLPELQRVFKQFPAVAILGARQVGKSTLLRQMLPQPKLFDLARVADFELMHHDIDSFLDQQEHPVIFDEAQLIPALFAALCHQIDKNNQKPGEYLLSGSSSPLLLKQIHPSLAGRIAICELGSWPSITA